MTLNKFIWCLLLLALVSCSSREEKAKIIKNPNIIVLLTDQERYPAHWPEGWVEQNLPSFARLKKHGLTFHRAYTAACECSPSRAVLTTSEHYPINQVPRTPPIPDLPSASKLMDIGAILKEHSDYEVVWKGKWHLSLPENGGNWTEQDIANMLNKYDLAGWNPPDAGNAIQEFEKNQNGTFYSGLATLGGGYANNDGRYVEGKNKNDSHETPGFGTSILNYLKKVGSTKKEDRKPFCLFISLVNPHDIWVYPGLWKIAGYHQDDFANLGIDLPSNYEDNLTTKPSIQLKARNAYNAKSPLDGKKAQKEYVNFYAYLHKVVDKHIETILNALDQAGLTEDTIIIRTADHGELGLSHGMREKAYTVYEEMIHIPLIISNPKLFPAPESTQAFYSHLDLLPTIAELANVSDFHRYGKGNSIVPIINNPNHSIQDSILFTYDDVFFLPQDTPGSHIRAIREEDWTYAVYYSEDGSHFEYEMYDLKKDPKQLVNLLYKDVSPYISQKAKTLHQNLTAKIKESSALPKDFPWPSSPF